MFIVFTNPYIGRFAPSPTGPLHFGSLVAAVASYCDAKANNGKWLLRMEDLDKPRTVKGAADNILRALAAFGFEWDSDDSNTKVMHQSTRDEYYAAALNALQKQAVIYPCTCTRKEIADSATSSGIEGAIYPKTCLNHPPSTSSIHAACRAVVADDNISFFDGIQGKITQNLARDIGDFIVKRADGLFAYQLAVVVDDAGQGVTNIVRGADLINSTTRQIYLQQLLGYTTPHYAHVPVACNFAGEKLSKQTLAKPIESGLASNFTSSRLIFEALSFLGQVPPLDLKNASLDECWRWAISNWSLANVPKQAQLKIKQSVT